MYDSQPPEDVNDDPRSLKDVLKEIKKWRSERLTAQIANLKANPPKKSPSETVPEFFLTKKRHEKRLEALEDSLGTFPHLIDDFSEILSSGEYTIYPLTKQYVEDSETILKRLFPLNYTADITPQPVHFQGVTSFNWDGLGANTDTVSIVNHVVRTTLNIYNSKK